MALQRNPNDPYDPDRSTTRLNQGIENSGLPDNRITSSRMILAALAVVVLIGALFYGMNMSSVPPTTANQGTDTTTGSAPASPQTPATPPNNSTTGPAR